MPWKETQLLEARARFVWAVKAAHESFAGLCRQFGLSRKTGCKWWQRGRATGLKALEDRSRRPLRPPAACASGWQERLRRARQQPPHWGPKKLRRWLGQRHPPVRRFPAVSTLARWLGRLKLMGPPSRRARRGPVLKPQALTQARAANEVWTVDFKGWFRTGNGTRVEPLTVRDWHSRFILGIQLLPNQSDAAVRAALTRRFRRLGLPQVIRVDNGAPFGGHGALGLAAALGVVAAPGHGRGVYPARSSRRQRRPRTEAPRVQSPDHAAADAHPARPADPQLSLAALRQPAATA